MPSAAQRLAARTNKVMFAGFGAWLATLVLFWLKALGPLRSFATPPPETAAWPWLAGSAALAAAALLLPRAYYRTAPFERDGRVYELLGVRRFRALMANGDLINRIIRRRHPGYMVHAGSARLGDAALEGFRSERAHLVLLLFALGSTAFAFAADWIAWALWLAASNIVANLYPVLLQRYTRARIWRLSPDAVKGAIS